MGILEVILLLGAVLVVLAIVIAFCCHCLHSEGEWAGHRVWDKTTPNVTDATKHYPDIEAGWADTPVDRPPLPRRAQLNEAARFKHIGPMCRSKEDAEQKSVERNSKYPQEVGEINTVFQVTLERSNKLLWSNLKLTQVNPDDFFIDANTRYGEVLKSREAVRYWDCKKISDSKYQVGNGSIIHGCRPVVVCGLFDYFRWDATTPRTKNIWKLFYWFQLDWKSIANLLEQGSEGGRMHAVFLMRDEGCHYSPKESRKTRGSRNSSRGRSNQRNTSRSRSTTRYRDQTWRLIRYILCHWQSTSMSAFRADLFSRVSQIRNQTNEQDLNI